MPADGGTPAPFHLGWRRNGDRFDVALAVNRLRARGARAWRVAADRDASEVGDYIVELEPGQRRQVEALGLRIEPWTGPLPPDAAQLAAPVAVLFAGTASRYPYYAYYALTLLRLGVAYVPVDGAALAGDALDHANLAVLPGGFSTWGIDKAEAAPGADRRMQDFLAEGGTAIGSCGGAFYLSAGRPDWTGTARAKPLYTHEYLQSGVGVVEVALEQDALAAGCPPSMEIPYYHGPIYDLLGPGLTVVGRFHALTLPGALGIPNPLDHPRFERDMKGKPAILLAEGNRGRAVLFSPHPEMGDLVRKYITLHDYVGKYLPIRGYAIMRDTMRHYRVTDAPSFRLVQNAIDLLMTTARAAHPIAELGGDPRDTASGLCALCLAEARALPAFPPGEEGDLLRLVLGEIEAQIAPSAGRAEAALARLDDTPEPGPMRAAWRYLVDTVAEQFATAASRSVSQRLLELELAVSLMACWARVVEVDLALAVPETAEVETA